MFLNGTHMTQIRLIFTSIFTDVQ